MENNNELVITRVFDTPVEEVWKYWTDQELYKKWWGPKIFSCPFSEIDFRVGGKYLLCMRGLEGEFKGKDFWSTGTYKEIVSMKKIVVSDSFADEKGNVIPASHYGMNSDFPLEMQVIVMFEEVDGPPSHKASEGQRKTKMTLKHEGMPAGKDSEGARQGWNESFDKLADSLKKV